MHQAQKRCVFFLFIVMGILLLNTGALWAAEVFLKNGDRISGRLTESDQEAYILETESMGLVQIRKEAVDRVVEDAGDQPQAPSAPELPEPAAAESLWDGEISAGFDRRRGNTSTTEITGGFLLHYKLDNEEDKNEFHLKGTAYYSEEDRKMNARKYYGMTRYAFSFGESRRWFNFYKLEVDHDRFSNIDYRFLPSTGIGYWFLDQEDTKLLFELGVGLSHTNYHTGEASTTEGILIPRIYAEKKLLGELKISEDFTLYPSLTEPGDFRFRSETILEHPLTEHVHIRAVLLDEYNSTPGAAAKKNDVRLTSALVYTF